MVAPEVSVVRFNVSMMFVYFTALTTYYAFMIIFLKDVKDLELTKQQSEFRQAAEVITYISAVFSGLVGLGALALRLQGCTTLAQLSTCTRCSHVVHV